MKNQPNQTPESPQSEDEKRAAQEKSFKEELHKIARKFGALTPEQEKELFEPPKNFFLQAMRGPMICVYPASPEVAPITEQQRILFNLRAIENPGERAPELKKAIESCEKKLKEMQDLYKNNRAEYYKKYCPDALITQEEREAKLIDTAKNFIQSRAKSKKFDNNQRGNGK